MRKLILLMVAAIAGLGVSAQTTYPAAGDAAPGFTVKMFDGDEVKLSELKGKVVLINFWATWCPPCRNEFKNVEKGLIEHFAGQDFVFLPISRGEARETVAKFRETNGYTFPMGLDPDGSIFGLYADRGIPRNFVVGKDGKITLAETGYTPAKFAAMVAHIEELLKQ